MMITACAPSLGGAKPLRAVLLVVVTAMLWTLTAFNSPAWAQTKPSLSGGSATITAGSWAMFVLRPTEGGVVSIKTHPSHGTVTIDDGQATYQNAGVIGPDSFVLVATNAAGESAPAIYTITANAPNKPVIQGGNLNLAFNTAGYHAFGPTNGGVVAITSPPSHGTLTLDGGLATYYPNTDYIGADSFSAVATNLGGSSAVATVTVSVAPPPIPALTGGSLAVAFEGSAQHNFRPTNGGVLALSRGPVSGSVTISGGLATYTANPGYFGADSFGVIATNAGGASAEMNVAVTVAPPAAPSAGNSTLSTPFNTPGTVTLPVAGLYSSIRVVDQGAHGLVAISGAEATYTAEDGFYGDDAFTYEAVGPGGPSGPATVTVRVARPDAPVVSALSLAAPHGGNVTGTLAISGLFTAVRVDVAPAAGTASVAGTAVSYSAAPGFSGVERFSVVAQGPGGDSVPAEVTVTVAAAPITTPTPEPEPTNPGTDPEPPIVAPAEVTQEGQAGTTMRIHLGAIAAAVGASGIELVQAPAVGSATIEHLDILFTPPADFAGDVALDYRLQMPQGGMLPATVRATVHPVPSEAVQESVAVVGANGAGEVALTEGAANGPFSDAAVLSVSPADAGTVEIVRSAPAPRASRAGFAAAPVEAPEDNFKMRFNPAEGFYGEVVVRYTLTNRFNAPTQGVARFMVDNRADPTRDAKVAAIANAQAQAANRFGTAQMSNVTRRMEARRDGATAGAGIGLAAARPSSDPFADTMRERTIKEMGAQLAAAQSGDQQTEQVEKAPGKETPVMVWTGGTLELGKRKGDVSAAGFDFATAGVSLGADAQVSEKVIVGLGVGAGRDTSDLGDGAKVSAKAASVFAYASYGGAGSFFVDGLVGYGVLDFDATRISNDATVTGSRAGDQTFAAISAGWELTRGAAHIAPYGRLELTRSRLKAYSEQGPATDVLVFDTLNVEQQSGVLGLRGRYAVKTDLGLFEPSMRAEYVWSLRSSGEASVGYAVGSDRRYQLPLAMADERRGLVGGGLRWTTEGRWIFSLDLERLFSDGGDSTAIRLGGSGSF